jgi:hypothetical protein
MTSAPSARTPPAPPHDSERNQSTEIDGAPPGYAYIHTPLPNVQYFNHNAYAKDRKRNENNIPYLLTDQQPSTILYTISCVVMQLITILQMQETF